MQCIWSNGGEAPKFYKVRRNEKIRPTPCHYHRIPWKVYGGKTVYGKIKGCILMKNVCAGIVWLVFKRSLMRAHESTFQTCPTDGPAPVSGSSTGGVELNP